MDELLKKLQAASEPAASGTSGSGGLAGVLGGALGGGLGGSMGGGLGGLLGGGLGALLPALLPSVLGMLGSQAGGGQSGMHQLIDGLKANGMGGVADSWVGGGDNEPISPEQVEQALGPEKLQQLSSESGLPTAQVSQGLAAILPELVNHLTPDGQVPSTDTVSQRVGDLLRGPSNP